MTKSANRNLFTNSTSFIAIAVFVVVALSAVAAAVFQRVNRGSVAPNAPESQPQAQVFTSDTCSLDITVGEPSSIECLKRAFQDEFDNSPGVYNLRQIIQTIQAGQVIVWAVDVTNSGTDTITISLNDVFTGNNLDSLTFMDSNCGTSAYNSTTRTLSCELSDVVGNGGQARVIFRTRVANTTPLDTVITNTAGLTSGTLTASCMASVTVDELTEQKMCNEPCETDKECSDEDNQQCVDTGAGFFCRNVACEDDADCICGSTPTPSPTPTPSNTPTPSPTPTPSNTPTPTPGTGGSTPTPTPSNTPTPTPSNTPTPSPSPTPYTDLELQKSVDDTTPTVGQNVTFTVQVFNRGPFADTNVTVRDVLPSGLAYISSNATRGSYNSSTNIWTIGNLAVNETVYLYITVRVDSASTITNMAEVWTGTLPDIDSTPGNSVTGEDDQDDVTLNPSKAPVQCGQTCTYNSDCADSNHICYNTGSGYVCRLASNPNSSTCAVATNTPSPTPATPQLPQSGGTGSTFVIIATAITILVLAALGLLLLL